MESTQRNWEKGWFVGENKRDGCAYIPYWQACTTQDIKISYVCFDVWQEDNDISSVSSGLLSQALKLAKLD